MSHDREHRLVVRDGEADTADVVAFERSRRDLVRRGLVGSGAVLAASSIPLLLRARNAFAQSGTDREIVAQALGLEQIAVFAYGQALASDLLRGPVRQVARDFRAHEQEHVAALQTALEGLGGRAPDKPNSVSDVDDVVKGLGEVRSQSDVVAFAIELETAAVAAYYDATMKLRDASLLQTGAQIMANEGQHLVVLRQAADRKPVPDAFETGNTK